MNDTKRTITYLRGTEGLRSAAGLVFDLSANELFSGAELLEWHLDENRALDLELRLQPLSATFDEPGIPVWRYNVELGHGDNTYKFPPATPNVVAENPVLPHRGMVARLSAKQLRIQIGCVAGEGALPVKSRVAISVQPVFAGDRPRVVTSDLCLASEQIHRFPPEATRWRVRDLTGLPIPIGIATITLTTINGITISAALDAAVFFDWTPIPVLAAFWSAQFAQSVQAEFE